MLLPYLHIHHIVHADTAQLWELLPALLEEGRDGVALLDLCDGDRRSTCVYLGGQARHELHCSGQTYRHALPVAAPVPVRVDNLDFFVLEVLLFA